MLELSDLTLAIYPDDQKTFGPCECCGNMTSRVWGYVNHLDTGIAAYFVEWTPGHDARQAMFDIIVGSWGEQTDSSDRQAVSLEFRKLETGPAFMVVEAGERTIAKSSLISRTLNRVDVIGTPIAAQVFAICDAMFPE